MDSRGGCCIARYTGGGGDMSKVDRIMLRFRPIAPKPANPSSTPVTSPPEAIDLNSRTYRGRRRCKTFNCKNGKKCNGNGTRKRKVLKGEKVDASVVTLPLLPESSDRKEEPSSYVEFLPTGQAKSAPTWLSFGSSNAEDVDHDEKMLSVLMSADRTVVMPRVTKVLGSCVTVECVSDTWVDVDGLGRTDEEKRANLERDTCPGIISDGFGRVTWTNQAYRKMVSHSGVADDDAVEVTVWLMMKKEVIPLTTELPGLLAFTCRVRVEYQSTCVNVNGKELRSSITVPCDVWRMNGGGFAWRLDVKAALCLGR
ncbi:hypothetical protein K2173_007844 [Erythroxylum novogranatense]|uniref:DUF7950 domain-containing protein n=1 Tax=Erythroxylum novogranatense TaxID=1862640 RepID=A0AAV8S6Y9_9ROSI|nr:hypothetical protein K2173_007844 [Erythroxylum novogranatense]